MIYRIAFTRKAKADLGEALRWKSERSNQVAARWYAGLNQAIAKLSKYPGRHPIAEDDSEELGFTVRKMIYGRKPGIYRVLFSIEGETIILHEIRHAARGPIGDEGPP